MNDPINDVIRHGEALHRALFGETHQSTPESPTHAKMTAEGSYKGTIQRIREARELFREMMKLSRALGVESGYAKYCAVKFVLEQTGLDLEKIYLLDDSLPYQHEGYYSPTDLGRITNRKFSGRHINKVLEHFGIQTRVRNRWVGNPQYRDHWDVVTVSTKPGGGSIKALRWKESVLDVIRQKIREENNPRHEVA